MQESGPGRLKGDLKILKLEITQPLGGTIKGAEWRMEREIGDKVREVRRNHIMELGLCQSDM